MVQGNNEKLYATCYCDIVYLYLFTIRSVVIAGHSAGSHLAAMLLHDSEWQNKEPHLNLLHGMIHISGVFDVVPLIETTMNLPLNLDR